MDLFPQPYCQQILNGACGKMSLSLFVWHQVILAYVRYGYIDKFNWITFSIYIILTLILSYISYKTIEKVKLNTRFQRIVFFTLLIFSTTTAFAIWRNNGVIRDVPELGIYKSNPNANRNTDYIDEIYKFQTPFVTNKNHILIIGNSFARDFGSILREYDKNNLIELSYEPKANDTKESIISKADYIFFFGAKHQVPKNIWKNLNDDCKIYGISTKCYGKNFGIYYSQRNKKDYFNITTVPSNSVCDSINDSWSKEWGKNILLI